MKFMQWIWGNDEQTKAKFNMLGLSATVIVNWFAGKC